MLNRIERITRDCIVRQNGEAIEPILHRGKRLLSVVEYLKSGVFAIITCK